MGDQDTARMNVALEISSLLRHRMQEMFWQELPSTFILRNESTTVIKY